MTCRGAVVRLGSCGRSTIGAADTWCLQRRREGSEQIRPGAVRIQGVHRRLVRRVGRGGIARELEGAWDTVNGTVGEVGEAMTTLDLISLVQFL